MNYYLNVVLGFGGATENKQKTLFTHIWVPGAHSGAPEVARNVVPGAWVNSTGVRAPEVDPWVQFLAFSFHFQPFFRLKTPRNLK